MSILQGTNVNNNKVVIGLSGGVDSSVSAYLLKQQGYEVLGVHIHMHDYSTFPIEDARKVAEHLKIEFAMLDAVNLFREKVTDYFTDEYFRGHTPNPCNICNRYVKFETLLNYANEVGAAYIATGHYANISHNSNGRYTISNSATAVKDQTYALCRLSQEQLSRILMPLAKYTKEEVRAIAKEAGIPVAMKKDSQDICFVPDGDYGRFLREYSKQKDIKGHFVHEDGTDLGPHEGITHYTVGQRRGLGIPAGERIFVKSIDAGSGNIILSDNESLYTDSFIVKSVCWMGIESPQETVRAKVKIRYAHSGTVGTISQVSDEYCRVELEEKVRAATPGQFAVFYQDDYIIGSGIITNEGDIYGN